MKSEKMRGIHIEDQINEHHTEVIKPTFRLS